MTDYPTCEERIDSYLDSSIRDIWRLWKWYQVRGDDTHPALQTTIHDYGLCFDYVEPDTFEDQPIGYWRYQLSWGGPSDEFRFYYNGNRVYRIEYWLLDWFDVAHRTLAGSDEELMMEIFDWMHCE